MRHHLITLVLLLFASLGLVGGSVAQDAVEIQHNAFNSTFLDSEIARRYGITRAENLAVVNVSVQRGGVIGAGLPASIKGSASNILHQVKPLEFREIREENAVYYIAPIRFDEGDTLTFTLDVTVEGEREARRVEWQQRFWKQ